jgi:hypothetical protein
MVKHSIALSCFTVRFALTRHKGEQQAKRTVQSTTINNQNPNQAEEKEQKNQKSQTTQER